MRRMLTTASIAAVLFGAAATAQAQWVPGPSVNGYPTFRHLPTGKTWTVTIGRVPSSDNGQQARLHLQQMGFRMPTFQELQAMYNFQGGGGLLRIHSDLFDYYETADPNILGNAYGNGFQTPQRRKGLGYNWYVGIRDF